MWGLAGWFRCHSGDSHISRRRAQQHFQKFQRGSGVTTEPSHSSLPLPRSMIGDHPLPPPPLAAAAAQEPEAPHRAKFILLSIISLDRLASQGKAAAAAASPAATTAAGGTPCQRATAETPAAA